MSATLSLPSLHDLLDPAGPISDVLPGYELREEQLRAATAIEEALATGRHCLIEAGTGVGKSLAYLLPAVRAIAEGKKTVISTHTIALQTQLIEKDIPRVLELFRRVMPGLKVKPVLMKGRGNYLCRQDLDAAEEDLFKLTDPLFRKLKRWARKTETGDAADLPFTYPEWYEVAANLDTCRGQECRYYDRCFYYRMRRNALDANLFVVNHALFLSDLSLRAIDPQSAILPHYDYVVFDEAHHLEEVATKVFGVEMSNRRVPRFIDRVRRTRGLDIDGTSLETAEALSAELFQLFETDRSDFFFHDVLGETAEAAAADSATRLAASLEGVVTDLTKQAKEAEDALKERLEGLARIGARLREELNTLFFHDDSAYIRWGENTLARRAGRGGIRDTIRTLHYTPIEVGERLREMLWENVDAAVLTSATLSNSGGFSYLRSRLAVPEDAVECVVGSPFDFRSQALLYVPCNLPSPKAAPEQLFADAAAAEIERLLALTEGRAFLLFTSRRMLNAVYDRLKDRLPYTLFRQGDLPPGQLLDAFRTSGDGCLFGVQSFWEGVDVQGQALSCVVIDRLPFAVPDSPITRARTDAIKERGGDWFTEFSVPQAQIRLKQGFGRLIRTRRDRGIVCILDTRLMTMPYGQEFVRYLPPASRASLWPRVERFWNAESAALTDAKRV